MDKHQQRRNMVDTINHVSDDMKANAEKFPDASYLVVGKARDYSSYVVSPLGKEQAIKLLEQALFDMKRQKGDNIRPWRKEPYKEPPLR